MLGVGLLAALITLMIQAFQPETNRLLDRARTEESQASGQDDARVMATPSEAVTSGQAVPTADSEPSEIGSVNEPVKEEAVPAIDKTLITSFLKTLIRVSISPQAP